jgi:hypothetical protein
LYVRVLVIVGIVVVVVDGSAITSEDDWVGEVDNVKRCCSLADRLEDRQVCKSPRIRTLVVYTNWFLEISMQLLQRYGQFSDNAKPKDSGFCSWPKNKSKE